MPRSRKNRRSAKAKQRRALKPLSERFRNHAPLGGSVAEREPGLAFYYTEKERYVGRVAQGLPGFFVLLGDKGAGKSAVQSMLAIELENGSYRAIQLKPEDIAIFSLTKDRLIAPRTDIDERWFAKTLWTYLICVEVVRREFRDFEGLWTNLKSTFRGDARRAKRLFEKAYSPDADQSMADRFLALVAEIEFEHTTAAGSSSGRVKTREPRDVGGQGVLHDLRELVRRLDETLDHDYVVLFDELDQDWNGETTQRLLLEQLLVAAENLSHRSRVSSCISMRRDIFNRLSIDDIDKMEDVLVDVSWTPQSLRRMVDRRIGYHSSRDTGVDSVFTDDCSKEKMWSAASGNPRRAIQIVERSIMRAQERGEVQVTRDIHLEVLRDCSDKFLRAHEIVHRILYPDLRKVALLLRGVNKAFDYSQLELFAIRVSEAADLGKMPPWAAESSGNPLELAEKMLRSGILLAKLNRKAPAVGFNDAIHPLDESLWFEVHSAYAVAIGIV